MKSRFTNLGKFELLERAGCFRLFAREHSDGFKVFQVHSRGEYYGNAMWYEGLDFNKAFKFLVEIC